MWHLLQLLQMHVVYYITDVTNKAHKIVNCLAGQSRLQPAQVLLSRPQSLQLHHQLLQRS